MRYVLFLIATLSSMAQDRYHCELKPLDLRKQGKPYFYSGINQITTDGNHLFLRSYSETEILVITTGGEFVRRIGGKGHHPSEFGDQGVMAIAVRGNGLMGIDANNIRARYFVDSIYRTSFRLKSYNRLGRLPTSSNVFAFSEKETVIPVSPTSGHLAAVYDREGRFVKYIGELIPVDERLEAIVSGINDTLWLHHRNRWYCIHKFFPFVTVYDETFQATTQFQVESPLVGEMFDNLLGFEPDHRANVPTPILTDAQIFRGDLYILGGGWLHQLNLKTGKLKSVTSYYGTGEEFARVTAPFVTLYTFALPANGKLVLGHHAQMWDHDLWTVELPFLKAGPSP